MKPTLSFQRPNEAIRCRLLSPGHRVKDIADACRSAALAFAWCAHRAWSRRELARWLVGPYASAISQPHEARIRRVAADAGPLDEDFVSDLLVRAHGQVLEALRTVHDWKNDPCFARDMVDGGFVIGVIDETDAIGYAPVDVWNMRLVDRVRSLFVADYLTRPTDYETFVICEGCDGATFDGAESHRATCHDELSAPASTTRLRRRRRTLVGLGEEDYEYDVDFGGAIEVA